VVLPLVVSFQGAEAFFRSPAIVAIFVVAVAFLMVSRIPTYSFKKMRVPREYILIVLIVVGLLAAVIWSYPWATLTLFGVLYIVAIPLGVRSYRRYADLGDPRGQGSGRRLEHRLTQLAVGSDLDLPNALA
jgi:CDP-diacylglycerol--serine O-phosphatidyltransferase